jgi:hypothetical protein
MTALSRLHRLSDLGQSVWVDYLSRPLLRSGELVRMVQEDAVTGVTSNFTARRGATTDSFRLRSARSWHTTRGRPSRRRHD